MTCFEILCFQYLSISIAHVKVLWSQEWNLAPVNKTVNKRMGFYNADISLIRWAIKMILYAIIGWNKVGCMMSSLPCLSDLGTWESLGLKLDSDILELIKEEDIENDEIGQFLSPHRVLIAKIEPKTRETTPTQNTLIQSQNHEQ